MLERFKRQSPNVSTRVEGVVLPPRLASSPHSDNVTVNDIGRMMLHGCPKNRSCLGACQSQRRQRRPRAEPRLLWCACAQCQAPPAPNSPHGAALGRAAAADSSSPPHLLPSPFSRTQAFMRGSHAYRAGGTTAPRPRISGSCMSRSHRILARMSVVNHGGSCCGVVDTRCSSC